MSSACNFSSWPPSAASVRRFGATFSFATASPNCKASSVSRAVLAGGRTDEVTRTATTAWPPSDGCSRRVSAELRYCAGRPAVSAWTATRSQWSDLLTATPCATAACDELSVGPSEPARSMSISVADVASRSVVHSSSGGGGDGEAAPASAAAAPEGSDSSASAVFAAASASRAVHILR